MELQPIETNINLQDLETQCREISRQSDLDRMELLAQKIQKEGIRDEQERAALTDLIRMSKAALDRIDTVSKPVLSYFYNLHRAAVSYVKPWKERWEKIDSIFRRAASKYDTERIESERRAQQELLLAAEQERQRLEQEAKRAMRRGEVSRAQELQTTAMLISAPAVVSKTANRDGESPVEVWEVEVTDPVAAARGVADGVIPPEAIKAWDMAFLRREAAARSGLEGWPGISAKRVVQVRVRR